MRSHMITRKAVAARIYELCNERGWSPNHLSYIAGVSQSTIKSILNDESKNPGVVTIKKICDGFSITLTDFFNSDFFSHPDEEEV